eukprot:470983-Prymnesium_polylepis.2
MTALHEGLRSTGLRHGEHQQVSRASRRRPAAMCRSHCIDRPVLVRMAGSSPSTIGIVHSFDPVQLGTVQPFQSAWRTDCVGWCGRHSRICVAAMLYQALPRLCLTLAWPDPAACASLLWWLWTLWALGLARGPKNGRYVHCHGPCVYPR